MRPLVPARRRRPSAVAGLLRRPCDGEQDDGRLHRPQGLPLAGHDQQVTGGSVPADVSRGKPHPPTGDLYRRLTRIVVLVQTASTGQGDRCLVQRLSGPAADPVGAVAAGRGLRQLPRGRLYQRHALAIAALVGIALVHLVQLPDTFRQAPGLGALFTALVLGAPLVAAALLHLDHRLLWHAATVIGGYVLTRSVAVPFDTQDVGDWLEPLGLVALFLESSLLALYGYRMRAVPARYIPSVSGTDRISVSAHTLTG